MLDSWLFLFCSGVLIFGVGLETVKSACTAGAVLCVVFYGSSKIFVYCFLVEKVYQVWSPTSEGGRRIHSRIWIVSMLLTRIGYLAVLVLMFIGLIHYQREDGMCVIGFQPFASITLVAFNLFITIFLNTLFLYPLFHTKIHNPRLKAVVVKTVIAYFVALIASTANMVALTVMRGRLLGWVCLGGCAADVIVNALAIFLITLKTPESSGHLVDGPVDHTDRSRHGHATTVNSDHVSKIVGPFNLGTSTGGKYKGIFASRRDEPHPLQVMVTTRTSLDRDGQRSDTLSETKVEH
ncbi:hypothetical protein PM082_006917 [Marasmius tenuissimus]|nr:hypothetical protein PM082_006917 [Marasmius tenuissimus]